MRAGINSDNACRRRSADTVMRMGLLPVYDLQAARNPSIGFRAAFFRMGRRATPSYTNRQTNVRSLSFLFQMICLATHHRLPSDALLRHS